MNDPELLRQRKAAEAEPGDPRPHYRYRVMALKAGAPLRPIPGDQVALDDEDADGVVVRVREVSGGPEEVSVRIGSQTHKVGCDALKIVSPHRPAVLLGEDELAKRLEEDCADPHDPRALETLEEVARRRLKEGVPAALDLFAAVEDGADEPLRRVLTQICRSRPIGELEVELLHRKLSGSARDLAGIPLLAAAVSEVGAARDLLDRLEALPYAEACRVVLRCGRNLVGAGGPGFVDAELRERVAVLSREHPDHSVRVALFLHAVPVLQSDEILIEKALMSTTGAVRARAIEELIRRGRREVALEHLLSDKDPLVLCAGARKLPAPFPAALLPRCLEFGRKDAALEEATLLRLPELGAAGLEALEPWLKNGRKTNLEAAIWAAGLLPPGAQAEGLLGLLKSLERLDRIALVLEALVRLGHETAAPALDAWGAALVEAGPWGEEVVDQCGLLLGRRVDARELLGRYVVSPPQHPIRVARALEAAAWLVGRGEPEAARSAQAWLPSGIPRFAGLALG